ncbi:MAG: hypothetical protein ACLU5J_08190 [Christensenellales bacterium]
MNYKELSYKFMRIFRKRNHLIHRVKELDKGENGILQTLFIYEEIHQKI